MTLRFTIRMGLPESQIKRLRGTRYQPLPVASPAAIWRGTAICPTPLSALRFCVRTFRSEERSIGGAHLRALMPEAEREILLLVSRSVTDVRSRRRTTTSDPSGRLRCQICATPSCSALFTPRRMEQQRWLTPTFRPMAPASEEQEERTRSSSPCLLIGMGWARSSQERMANTITAA